MKLWDFCPKLFNPLYLRIVFKNRQNAGQILGDNLKMLFKSGKNKGFDQDDYSILVVGIPRGGLIVADEIAKKLNCDLDLIYNLLRRMMRGSINPKSGLKQLQSIKYSVKMGEYNLH